MYYHSKHITVFSTHTRTQSISMKSSCEAGQTGHVPPHCKIRSG